MPRSLATPCGRPVDVVYDSSQNSPAEIATVAGSVSSLNVSVATGVCLFEAMRQRGAKAKAGAKKA